MIWTTWRQHRGEAFVGALLLVGLAAAMVVVGSVARNRARALGLPGCPGAGQDCGDALGRLHADFHTIPPFTSGLVAIPLFVGMFWAAPLVSREYEAGTHRLAWTQSVSPKRWISTKIALIFAAVGAGALIIGLLAAWTLDPLTSAFGGRYNSTWYDIQGIVPVACVLFALAVGVAASALIRRTVPAMAVTLVAYAAARIPVHWIRWHFAPLTTRTLTIPLASLLQNPVGSPREAALVPTGSWLHSLTATNASGQSIPVDAGNFDLLHLYCPNLQIDRSRTAVLNPEACRGRVANLSLHERITYQPTSHFWLIQVVESLVFLGLAAVLVAVAILAVSRHRAA